MATAGIGIARASRPALAPAKRLAIVGGGPKAVAIAAKARELHTAGGPWIDITVFDPFGIGAAWNGSTGYTDGDQRLCTLIERDLGFPYSGRFLDAAWGDRVTAAMRRHWSWHAFLESRSPDHLSQWVDGGRLPPTHREFAEYLQWASGATPTRRHTVTELRPVSNQWELHVTEPGVPAELFDAVVLTGSGPVRQVAGAPGASAGRLFNGRDFWTRLDEVRRLIEARKQRASAADIDPIVVVGAGGTSAAILAWLVENGARDMPIVVIADAQATLHLRSENPFENRLFNSAVWETLAPDTRRRFSERLTRGVVWETVLDRVARATQLVFIEGRASGLAPEPHGSLRLDYTRFDSLHTPAHGLPTPVTSTGHETAGLLIDASGFDGMAWTSLFPFVTLPPVHPPGPYRAFRDDLELRMKEALQLTGPDWDHKAPVHVPLLSHMIGPGYASLMSLGDMADRILRLHGA